jgi:hypothetical protein
MRIVFFFLFLTVVHFSFSQQTVQIPAGKLEKALLEKDTVSLKQLLHSDLSYGHSNGWTETKTEMISNLVSGKMKYTHINTSESVYKQTGDVMSVKAKTKIGYEVDGKSGELDLFVMQVWIKENNDWKLLVRQSTKLN